MADLKQSRQEGLARLLQGKAPGNAELLRETAEGLDSLIDFLTRHYLESYIPDGGSKIKFVTGLQGSGKTFFAENMLLAAEQRKYLTVTISARELWLHDFKAVYLEILRQCDLEKVLQACASQIIREMGYDPETIPAGKTLMDVLSEKGEGDAFSKGEIREALRRNFTRNPLLDNTFAVCCSLLTGDLLGYPVLENTYRELILAWMHGDSSVKAAQMKAIGMSPVRVSKYNARNLLRSLCEVVHMSGRAGLLISVDDLEQLISKNADGQIRYTKGRREDAYESIRQLIDDIDSMRYVLFLFCMDREMLDDDSLGVKSYQALWMRMQNEVISIRFNRFGDIVDMDRYGDESYGEETIQEMSRKLTDVLTRAGKDARTMSREAAAQLKARAVFGKLGIPYLVNRITVEGEKEHG
jgi:Cdc6-like AAA superfamily ATPase